MNDPEEATAADVPLAASSVFVSCWSAGDVEHIPMWSMYGRNFEGVRIKLPSNMFAGRESPMVFEKGGAIGSFAGQYRDFRELDYIKEVSLADHHPLFDVEYLLRAT